MVYTELEYMSNLIYKMILTVPIIGKICKHTFRVDNDRIVALNIEANLTLFGSYLVSIFRVFI